MTKIYIIIVIVQGVTILEENSREIPEGGLGRSSEPIISNTIFVFYFG